MLLCKGHKTLLWSATKHYFGVQRHIIYTTLECPTAAIRCVGPNLGVQPINSSRILTFWKWTATKHHYLHAFGHIADIVTKHRFYMRLVSLDFFNKKTRMILLPPPV